MYREPSIISPDRSGKLLVYIISVLLLIIAIVLYLHFPSGYNQSLYHYQGLVMKHGGLPYEGFVEKKGVLALLTYGFASLLFGEAAWAYRLFDLLILSGIAFTLYKIVSYQYNRWLAVLAIGLWGSHVLIDAPGNTGDVTNLITLFTLILARHLSHDKKSVNYLWAGILMALSCWVKPTAILIYIPLGFLFFNGPDGIRFQWSFSIILKVLTGLFIPALALGSYLFITGTFRSFWEALVLEPYLHYAPDKFRLSIWALKRTAYLFIQDPVLRVGGILSLFLIRGGTFLRVLQLLVVGTFTMVTLEGRLFPYHFSIIWPFLTIGFIHGIQYLSRYVNSKSFGLVTIALLLITHIPLAKTGIRFQKAGFLTADFNPGAVFVIEDFKEMHRLRKPVIGYLKLKLQADDEIFVFGEDANFYLELSAITSCRFARDAFMLTEMESESTPQLIKDWKKEYLGYLEAGKSDWLIVLKRLADKIDPRYQSRVQRVLNENYQPVKETEGHIIYKKR